MGTGYTRNDTANNIADGNVINASDLDGEFDAIQTAFNASSGHSHDGTTGQGPKIDASGIADNAVALGTKTTGNYVATLTAGALIDLQNNSGEGATPTIDVDLTELTDMTETAVGADELVILDGGTAQKRKAISEIPLSIFNNDGSFSSTTGTVTSVGVAAGALIDVTGDTTITSSGTATIAVDLTELADMTQTFVAADEFVVLDGGAAGTQKRKPASEIPISVFNNDSGFTSNTGDITGVTAGTGLSGGGSSGGVTLALDLSELTDMTGSASGTTEFILQDGTTESRKAASEIDLTIFNNNLSIDADNTTISNLEVDNLKSGVLDTDISSVAGTDTTLASAKAIKTYVDAQVGGVSTSLSSDSNPSLGGNLDTNSHNIFIDDAHFIGDENGNEQIVFQTTASAVNQVEVTNAATGGHPLIQATGDDTNINLKLDGKGSGVVNVVDGLTVGGDLTVNGTTTTVATSNTVISDGRIELANGTTGSPTNDTGIVIERGSADNAFIGFDESEDKFKVGTGSFTGGTSDANLTIATGTMVANLEGNVTGNVTGTIQNGSSGDPYTFPASDGSNGQVLQTNGSGALSFSSAFTSGMILPFAGSSAPTGWLLSYGQAVSRTTYASLFTAIGTTYGSGDGSSTFNLPDLRGRVVAGQDDMGGVSADNLTNVAGDGLNGDTLGATGGSENHVLTTTQLASHTHGAGSFVANTTRRVGGGGSGSHVDMTDAASNVAQTFSVSGTSGSAGSGAAHNNVQPTIILNYIIKT